MPPLHHSSHHHLDHQDQTSIAAFPMTVSHYPGSPQSINMTGCTTHLCSYLAKETLYATMAANNSKKQRIPGGVTKPKKSVSFSHLARSVVYTSRDDFTQEEIQAAWYSDDEKELMIRESILILRRMEARAVQGGNSNSTSHDDDNLCTRGLEVRLRSNSLAYRARRTEAWNAVHTVQRLQNFKGTLLPYVMAEMYQVISIQATRNALYRAKMDVLAAIAVEEDEPVVDEI